ncbi:Alpha-xylosidase BoGH31A [termite gut metagenome]|uniref:Alpha-xylosidase BoGH31A n=1 Tax=termite gut metagenome TaxID=433724 RepID=A0A5J4S5I7_9ZZZZ
MGKNILLLITLFITGQLIAQNFQKTTQGIKGNTQGMDIQIEFYSPSVVRVYKTPEGKPYEKKSLIVTKIPQAISVEFAENGNNITLKSSEIAVEVNKKSGAIHFYNADNDVLLLDKDYGTQFTFKWDSNSPSYIVRNAFLLDKDEAIYGVGQIMDNRMNRRNSKHHLQNENTHTTSPYFMSIKGYGLYWDNYSISDFNDNPQELSFESIGYCADYYFMYGKNADGVIANLRDLTGKAPMLPLWAYGYFQSKERYVTQDESLNVLKKYRELQVPIDAVIQDWRYWAECENDSNWNTQSFDAIRFPEPKKWIDEIHKNHAKLLIVTWPGFGPKTEQRKELDSKNMIINFNTWPPNSGTRPYDVYNPEALDIYWKYLNKGVFSYIGNDGWWLDSTEPDHIDRQESDYDLLTHLGTYRSVKNVYSVMHNSGIATHQKAQTKNKRVVILTRSGFIGQQRFGSNTWSGDVQSTWDMLEKQIPAALNYSLMGIPNWNSDIGGFFAGRWNKNGGAKNPEYQDLYLRWLQFGAFCPMMRSHGTEISREIWNFGERGDWCFDGIEKFINLRYRLLPYIYSTSWDVSQHNGTFMRALMMDFPLDKNTHDLGNEYLFGSSILVAPVTKPNVEKWSVYLPKGADWYDFWTNTKYSGGQSIDKGTPKDIMPLYIKAGSILPWGQKVQYSSEKSWRVLELKIYPGANGQFTLYEDEFDNYNYEIGQYSEITFTYDEVARTLTVGDRKGNFPGMLKSRNFQIVVAELGKTAGDMEMLQFNKIISYNGKQVTVKL